MHNGRFRLLEIIVLMCVASFRVMIFFVGISQKLSVVLSQSLQSMLSPTFVNLHRIPKSRT